MDENFDYVKSILKRTALEISILNHELREINLAISELADYPSQTPPEKEFADWMSDKATAVKISLDLSKRHLAQARIALGLGKPIWAL
jgi:hypothetical protein